jgi:hypothetical protein
MLFYPIYVNLCQKQPYSNVLSLEEKKILNPKLFIVY